MYYKSTYYTVALHANDLANLLIFKHARRIAFLRYKRFHIYRCFINDMRAVWRA